MSKTNQFLNLLNQARTDEEKKWLEKIFSMILRLRQQIVLRNKFEKED